jgi:hypothetical protein
MTPACISTVVQWTVQKSWTSRVSGRGNGVTAVRYIDQVLQPHIVQHFTRRQNLIVQHDNARAYKARVRPFQVFSMFSVRRRIG